MGSINDDAGNSGLLNSVTENPTASVGKTKVDPANGRNLLIFFGYKGERLYFDSDAGHFYRSKGNHGCLLYCADSLFFESDFAANSDKKKFKCSVKPGQMHHHSIPPREAVEVAAFRWACKLRIANFHFNNSLNVNEPISQSINFVLASWPQHSIISKTILKDFGKSFQSTLKRFRVQSKERSDEIREFLDMFSDQTFDRFRQTYFNLPPAEQSVPEERLLGEHFPSTRNLSPEPTHGAQEISVESSPNIKPSCELGDDTCLQFYEKSLVKFEEALVEHGQVFKRIYQNRGKTNIDIDKAISVANSLFEMSRLEQWLETKMKEIEIFRKITDVKKTIAFINEVQLQEQLNHSKKNDLHVILHIPPLDDWTRKTLEQMEQFPKIFSEDGTSDDYNLNPLSDDVPWHMVEEKRKEILEQIEQLVNHVEKNNELLKHVQFFINFSQNSKEFGCWYTVYKDGQVLMDNIFGLLDPPTGFSICILPARKSNEEIAVLLKWKYQVTGFPGHFLVEYRNANTVKWNQYKITILDVLGQSRMCFTFMSGLVMEFRVAANTCIGLSQFSPVVDTRNLVEAKTKEEQQVPVDSNQMTALTSKGAALGGN